jgi:hypothetical protein
MVAASEESTPSTMLCQTEPTSSALRIISLYQRVVKPLQGKDQRLGVVEGEDDQQQNGQVEQPL